MSALSEALGSAGSKLGARAGGAAGTGIGGLLGQVGDVLSAPRRALWSALGGPESGEELVSHLTGMDRENSLTKVLGMGAEILGDPLTYVGGLGGLLKGAALGGKIGRGLETAALVRGPNYAGGVEKLTQLAVPESEAFLHNLPERFTALASQPNARRILGEIPPQSTYLGAGAEGIALKTPAGDVLRIADNPIGQGLMPPRVRDPLVLQPTRDVAVGSTRVERVPFANVLPATKNMNEYRQAWNEMNQMGKELSSRGFEPTDLAMQNLGRYGGRRVVIDPGAVQWPAGYAPPEALPTQSPGRIQNALLRMLGSDPLVQNHLAQQAAASAAPSFGMSGFTPASPFAASGGVY